MTPEQQMIFGAILFALCIGLVVYCNLIRSGAKKIADEAHAKTESAKEEISNLESRLNKALNSQPQGSPLEYGFWVDAYHQKVVVFGEYQTAKEDTVLVAIKSFPIDDDLDFAKREAQELIDHLNEK